MGRFLSALRKNDTSAASALAAPGVGANSASGSAFTLTRSLPHRRVTAPNSDFPPNAGGFGSIGGPEIVDVERYCLLLTSAEGGEYFVLGMAKTGFQRWQVSSFNVT